MTESNDRTTMPPPGLWPLELVIQRQIEAEINDSASEYFEQLQIIRDYQEM